MASFYFIYLFYPSNASVSKAAEDNLREEGIKEEREERGKKSPVNPDCSFASDSWTECHMAVFI